LIGWDGQQWSAEAGAKLMQSFDHFA